uniref:Uncharacterized protein n=1 Tax=Caenorhabditis japonica TaxID=281687 RepID=A0A8R1I872_CAEJA
MGSFSKICTRVGFSSPELHHLSTGASHHPTSSTLGAAGGNNLLSVDKRHSRLGESSPNLSRIHHTHTQLSLGLPHGKMSHTNDFFSSTEYCQYVCSREDIDSFNGNSTAGGCKSSAEPIQAAFLRKSRKDGSVQLDDTQHHHHHHPQSKSARNLKYSQSSRRKYEQNSGSSSTDDSDRGSGSGSAHHRSHSAGPHSTYSTLAPNGAVSTSEMHRSGVIPRAGGSGADHNNTTFLRATKRFFKKIYTSATLPKKQNNNSSSSTSVDNFQKSSVFFDDEVDGGAHHRHKILKKAPLTSDENDYTTHLDDDYDDD